MSTEPIRVPPPDRDTVPIATRPAEAQPAPAAVRPAAPAPAGARPFAAQPAPIRPAPAAARPASPAPAGARPFAAEPTAAQPAPAQPALAQPAPAQSAAAEAATRPIPVDPDLPGEKAQRLVLAAVVVGVGVAISNPLSYLALAGLVLLTRWSGCGPGGVGRRCSGSGSPPTSSTSS
nr:hypothetical protein GCM10017745_45080 [Saccharothrix mutabilis subsp. capreolus]